MATNNGVVKSKWDSVKWVIILLLLAGGVAANYYYAQIPVALRAAGWIILLCIVVGIALLTDWGRRAFSFIQESRIEIRKVTWPTRQETIQMTAIVAGLVALMAIILWVVDSGLMWMVQLLT